MIKNEIKYNEIGPQQVWDPIHIHCHKIYLKICRIGVLCINGRLSHDLSYDCP